MGCGQSRGGPEAKYRSIKIDAQHCEFRGVIQYAQEKKQKKDPSKKTLTNSQNGVEYM